MKKSLLSLLAVAVAAVGCQNYDDQFDDLNSQIAALSSQVAGLAQVQSDLSALSTTVSNLQSGIANVVDDALADGLASIDDAIATLETAAESAASSEDVQAIADAVAEQDAVLEEVLANSSVQNGDVEITTTAQLDAWYALKGTLTIVNGNVTIEVSTEMDSAKVQEVLDEIVTVTKDFSYTADADVEFTAAFPNLSGTRSLTIDQEGNVILPLLANATIVEIDEDNSTLIVDLGALESVTSLSNGDGAGTFSFSKATNVHLTSLEAYDGDLTVEVNKGGTILLDAYRDVDSDGDATGYDLTIIGPTSFTVSELVGTGSTLTLKDVVTATVNGYNGTIVTDEGVENFSADHVVSWTVSGTDLVSVDVTGALDADEDAEDEDGPSITLENQGDLATVDIDGVLAGVTIQTNGNLASLIVGGSVDGTIDINNNSDLSSIDVSEATARTIDIDNNSDLESLTIDATIGEDADGDVNGSILVTDNESLASLTISTNKIGTLTITGNDDLETIDMTGVNSIGDAEGASVEISDNDLTADEVNAEDESITTSSGAETMADYLTAVDANADSDANVVFDTVETYIDEDGDDQGEKTSGTEVQILNLTAEDATPAKADIAAVRAFIVDISTLSDGDELGLENSDGVSLFSNGTTASVGGSATVSTNKDLLIANIKSQANLDRFNAYDITLNAYRGGNSTGTVSLIQFASGGATTVVGQRYTTGSAASAAVSATNYGFGLDDLLTLEVGGNSVTVSPGVTGTATTLTALGDAIESAWASKYGASGTASGSAIATVTNVAGVLTITMLDKAMAGYDVDVDLSVSAGTVTATNAANIDYVIGSNRLEGDDATTDADIIVTITSNDPGTILNSVSGVTTSTDSGGTSWVELTTTKLTNGTDPDSGYTAAQRSAAPVNAEDGSAKVVNTAAVAETKVEWL